MSLQNSPFPIEQNNIPNQFPSESQPLPLMDLEDLPQFSLDAESESPDYRFDFDQDISDPYIQQMRQDHSFHDLSFNLFEDPQDPQDSQISSEQDEIPSENHEAAENFMPDESQLISNDSLLISSQNNQINAEWKFQIQGQMSQSNIFKLRQNYQNDQILIQSSLQSDPIDVDSLRSFPQRHQKKQKRISKEVIIVQSDDSSVSEQSQSSQLPQESRNLKNPDVRVMNDMMRQTFVALQYDIETINFPLKKKTYESSETESSIRSMFEILKRLLSKIKRKSSGTSKVKSIPMKKMSMILFNNVDRSLNRGIEQITIPQIENYSDACQKLDQEIINQAKKLFRSKICSLMTRQWIYHMCLKAKFKRRNKKSFREFLQQYMQHVACQLQKNRIDPRAFNREFILSTYESMIAQENMH